MKTEPSPSEPDYTGVYLFNTSGCSLPVDRSTAQSIAAAIEMNESCTFQLVEIVFVDEQEIIRINREHLEHDFITDIITFRYDEDSSRESVEGTLYCCAPRIREQAYEFNQPMEEEFKRVIIHGLLHLVGYDDKSDTDKKQMRSREDFYLEQI